MYKIRFDVLICFLLAALMTMGVSKMLPGFYSMLYDRYTQAHTVADGEIGGKAGSDIFLAQNVEDLLSHDTFSVKVEYGSYETADTGYFGKIYLNNLELPSGERVAARVNFDTTQMKDNYFIMPVGKVVDADLSGDTEFLKQIERYEPLSRRDFYLDMLGNGGLISVNPERYDETYTVYIQAGTAVVTFFLFHIIGVKLGVFPRFLPRRKRKQGKDPVNSQKKS